jgi:ABC-type phosphate transport system substrate-binding protein
MTKQRWFPVAAALGVLLAGAERLVAGPPDDPAAPQLAAVPAGETLRITGSSTLAPLIADLAQQFQAKRPGVTISVEAGGSNRGIADVRSGLADIGMASRALKPEERDDLFAITIARDAVAFVVHRDNRVRAITRAQAAAIYEGRVTRWTALGGKDAPINAVSRPPSHSSLEIVADYLGLKSQRHMSLRIARRVPPVDTAVNAWVAICA